MVVGHSMGGLLTKTLVTASGTRLWDAVMTVPPEEVVGDPELVETFRRTLIFEPLPYVDRAVFISTPHRGSKLADAYAHSDPLAILEVKRILKEHLEGLRNP